MIDEKKIKKEIFDKIREFYRLKFQDKKFIPKKSKVHYAGKVFDENELISMTDAILNCWFTVGKFAREFENNFSKYIGLENTIITNSGSSANLLAVSCLLSSQLKSQLKKGDEVITPAMTFPTTFNPIIQNGLLPVLLDVELNTFNMRTDILEDALTKKTKLIIIPHSLGNCSDIKRIVDFANEHDLYVIEDTCDALGSEYDGKLLGTFGDISTFSFYPAHHMTMGEGGAICTNNFDLSTIIRSIRDWGRACACPVCKVNLDPDYVCPLLYQIEKTTTIPNDYDRKYTYLNIGYNLKPTEMQAAMGIEQLKKLSIFNKKREKNFKILYKEFIRYQDYFILPLFLKKSKPSWFCFPLTIDTNKFKRKDFIKWFVKHNIEIKLPFAGNIIRQPAYQDIEYRVIGNLNNSDRIMKNSFFIGIYPGLDSERINYMLEVIDEFMKKHT